MASALEIRKSVVKTYLDMLPKNLRDYADTALDELVSEWEAEASRRGRALTELSSASRRVPSPKDQPQ